LKLIKNLKLKVYFWLGKIFCSFWNRLSPHPL